MIPIPEGKTIVKCELYDGFVDAYYIDGYTKTYTEDYTLDAAILMSLSSNQIVTEEIANLIRITKSEAIEIIQANCEHVWEDDLDFNSYQVAMHEYLLWNRHNHNKTKHPETDDYNTSKCKHCEVLKKAGDREDSETTG